MTRVEVFDTTSDVVELNEHTPDFDPSKSSNSLKEIDFHDYKERQLSGQLLFNRPMIVDGDLHAY